MTGPMWVPVTTCDSIPLREGRGVKIGEYDLALFNLGDRFLATDNRCPHRGGPLCDGIVSGASVVCPLHAWKIDLESGAVARPAGGEGCVHTYQTRIEDGVVAVRLP